MVAAVSVAASGDKNSPRPHDRDAGCKWSSMKNVSLVLLLSVLIGCVHTVPAPPPVSPALVSAAQKTVLAAWPDAFAWRTLGWGGRWEIVSSHDASDPAHPVLTLGWCQSDPECAWQDAATKLKTREQELEPASRP